jgi:hypothetical protein
MAADAKRAALKVLIVVIAISAAVNAAAPGPLGLRIIFALIVGLVAGVEWVAGKIRPDFAAIEVRETELTTNTTVADTTPVNRTKAAVPAQAFTAPLATAGRDSAEVPAQLVSAARMITVQHRQTATEPITAEQLAARLNTTPAIAGQLLATIDNPSPVRINGHTPVLGGVR